VQHAREGVAPELIGSQQVVEPGRLQQVANVLLGGAVRGYDGRGNPCHDHQADDRAANHGQAGAGQASEELPERRARSADNGTGRRLRGGLELVCPHVHAYEMRGSSRAYIRSAARFERTRTSARKSTTPCTIGKSRAKM